MKMKSDFLKIGKQSVYFSSSETMDELEDNYVDVIVTSPPYNRGKNYLSDNNESHNDNLPEKDYLSFLENVWRECFRVGKDKCVFYLNIGDSASDQGISEKVADTAIKAGWKRIQDIIWVKSIYGKGHYTPSGGNKRFNNTWEHIYLFVKNKKKYVLDPKAIGIPYADKSNIGRYGDSDMRDPGNVWHITYEKTTGATVKKGHDAPFPIGLPYKCLKSVPGVELVLDPFLGTGTTLAAAEVLGLNGIGYEKYPKLELIKKTILDGRKYRPQPTVLIPHFTQTIELLDKILSRSNIRMDVPKTKKEMENLKIVNDTMQKLEIESKLSKKINKLLKLDKITGKIDKFIK
jgi:site-specific DNA-methyltransferase (adenine-specific)